MLRVVTVFSTPVTVFLPRAQENAGGPLFGLTPLAASKE